jgi:uncharacterized LabA/DUF88 family protein
VRIALFIDGAAMFYAQRENGWFIDYKKVHQYFSDNKQLNGAYYFTATPPASNHQAVDNYRRFKRFLIYTGYHVIDKEVKVINDQRTGQVKLKGNLDIELVFRMLAGINGYDEAIIFGGDSDYLSVVSHLRNLGKVVACVGRRQSTSIELINECDSFIDLSELRTRIERE